MKINLLDRGQGPILVGIDVLRGLGAIIDYGNDEVVFTKLAPDRVKRLEQSRVGHLLLDLTEDLLANSEPLDMPVYSLRSSQPS